MAFVRSAEAVPTLTGETLTAAMVGIGMNFASALRDGDADLETTLVAASVEGMDRDDFRVLGVLVTWFGVHSPWVNADRLTRLVATTSERTRAFWSALAHWKQSDRRFAKLARLYAGTPLDLLAVGTAFQLRRHGEDPRFAGSVLRVPAGTLRDRPADVLAPRELAVRHRAYRWRLVIGPTVRADAWAALEVDASLSAAELARRARCSFATAWHAQRDFAAWRTSMLPAVERTTSAGPAVEPRIQGTRATARRSGTAR